MGETISAQLRLYVRSREHDQCAYCHSPEELSIAAFELDHIVPVSAGGQTEPENLCLACSACNRSKAAQQEGDDPLTNASVPLFNPRSQIWGEHFMWRDDATRIEGLTPTGRATVELLQMNRPHLVRLRRLWLRLGIRLTP